MISALATHAWLLLTFRHNGSGLPGKKSECLFWAVAGVMVITAWLRWDFGFLQSVISVLMVFGVIALVSFPSVASGYAILSVSLDLMAIVVAGTDQQSHSETFWIFIVWEFAGLLVLSYRAAKARLA